jgi:hypothetical protein
MSAALDPLTHRVTSGPAFLASQLHAYQMCHRPQVPAGPPPGDLASQLHAYQMCHGLTDAALAALLGCDLPTLARVRLCGNVRVGNFAEDFRVVADRFGLAIDVLERICWPW